MPKCQSTFAATSNCQLPIAQCQWPTAPLHCTLCQSYMYGVSSREYISPGRPLCSTGLLSLLAPLRLHTFTLFRRPYRDCLHWGWLLHLHLHLRWHYHSLSSSSTGWIALGRFWQRLRSCKHARHMLLTFLRPALHNTENNLPYLIHYSSSLPQLLHDHHTPPHSILHISSHCGNSVLIN